jgi:hypothetical protein
MIASRSSDWAMARRTTTSFNAGCPSPIGSPVRVAAPELITISLNLRPCAWLRVMPSRSLSESNCAGPIRLTRSTSPLPSACTAASEVL